MKKTAVLSSAILAVFLFAGLGGCATYVPQPPSSSAGYAAPAQYASAPAQQQYASAAPVAGTRTVALQEDISCGNPFFVNRKNWESDYAQFGIFYQIQDKGSDYKIIIHGIRPVGSSWEVFFVDCARSCPSPQAAIEIMQQRGYRLQPNGAPRGEPSGKHPTVDAGRVLNY